jgi:hypothetical protein
MPLQLWTKQNWRLSCKVLAAGLVISAIFNVITVGIVTQSPAYSGAKWHAGVESTSVVQSKVQTLLQSLPCFHRVTVSVDVRVYLCVCVDGSLVEAAAWTYGGAASDVPSAHPSTGMLSAAFSIIFKVAIAILYAIHHWLCSCVRFRACCAARST